ncbi:Uncharacterized protein FKW44_001924 [Caligus rogercresseyi]|uniref:Uncharacterized protein n=1 Tax=Caligus rogercresseyi TaxID=217165 RepID=A0A7T8KJE4_CALRO|nr:Uncharacterized protein FKW44_001924 [Caligus rogercresseyi]
MTTLLESLNSDESKSIPPECLSIGNVLILKSPSKLNTYRLPHQSPIGSINLSESVQCMTAIESRDLSSFSSGMPRVPLHF